MQRRALAARCIPELMACGMGWKRGVFGPLSGQPAEETRPIEQTWKRPPRNFPPGPTSDSAGQTGRFRPDPVPPPGEFSGSPARPRNRPKTGRSSLQILGAAGAGSGDPPATRGSSEKPFVFSNRARPSPTKSLTFLNLLENIETYSGHFRRIAQHLRNHF